MAETMNHTDIATNAAEAVPAALIDDYLNESEVDSENMQKRCICMLLLDESYSVNSYSWLIEQTFPAFLRATEANSLSENIELGVYAFNRTAREILPIRELYRYIDDGTPELKLIPKGRTHTGTGILAALKAMDAREKLVREKIGTHTFVPVLVIVTDANPQYTDDPEERAQAEADWELACRTLRERIASRRLQVVVIGVGNDVNEESLRLMTGDNARRSTIRLENAEDFEKLFSAISAAFITASKGDALRPGYYVTEENGHADGGER